MSPNHPSDMNCPFHTTEPTTVLTQNKSSRLARTSTICLGLAASLLFAAGAAGAGPSSIKLDSSLSAAIGKSAAGSGAARQDVIVQTQGGFSPVMRRQVEEMGGNIHATFTIIRGFSASMPIRSLPKLAALPWVTRISSDASVKKLDDSADPAVGADIANTSLGLDGTGVTVAVLDSGADDNPDFSGKNSHQSRLIVGPNFSNEASPYDLCGHGTHVAGLIGGNGAMSTGSYFTRTFKGVAPGVRLLAIKALNFQGQCSIDAVLKGIQWCVQNRQKYNIRVLNMSMGHPVYESYTTDPLCQAVEAAWKAGIVVVCAAGNDGRSIANDRTSDPAFGTIESPANDPYVITVGATDTSDTPAINDDVVATYSSHGPTMVDRVLKPDLVAPGNRLISLVFPGTYLSQWSAENGVPLSYYTIFQSSYPSPVYFRLSGTSMAAAIVSGAAAILLEKDPTITPDTVKGRLMKTALKTWNPTVSYDYFFQGAGLLNIPAALACGDNVSGYALSPTVIRNGDGTLSLQDVSGSWGDSVIWSDAVIWSDSVVWGDSVIWDDSVVWGDSVIWDDSVVWGDSVIWDDSVVWGDGMMSALDGAGVDISGVAIHGDRPHPGDGGPGKGGPGKGGHGKGDTGKGGPGSGGPGNPGNSH